MYARDDLWSCQISLENFLAVTECADCAAFHNGKLVRYGENPYPVGDDDYRRIGRLHPFNCFEKHALAEVVEAGVRLVENHDVGITKKRPRKTETLAKATRQIGRCAKHRIVRLRQPNDRLVKAGQLCGFNNLLQIGIAQPRDDVLYRFSEQIDVLRQISEKPTAARIAHG